MPRHETAKTKYANCEPAVIVTEYDRSVDARSKVNCYTRRRRPKYRAGPTVTCSIVTESLSPTIFEIMGILYIWDVIGHVTNRSAICHFLLVSHCKRTSISNRFRDIRPPLPVRARAHTHTHTPQVILYSVPCNVLHWTDNEMCPAWT